jgi:effector-binding domain-containing protein
MSKGIRASFLALAIIIGVIVLRYFQSPDVSQYLALKDPAVRFMQPQKVLVVEATGTPEKVSKKALGLLLHTYFGIKGIPKGRSMPAPRIRWTLTASVPQSQWIGRCAMPIPDSITGIKLPEPPKGLTIQLATWEYGEVAEILHIGPYDKEEPAINRLHDFIKENGLVIVGDHEEEYVKGPGMFFKGNPKNYYTIIRYRVKTGDSTRVALNLSK